MTIYGKIIVIKRNGSDGSAFPLTSNTCLIGRDPHCDIRIQLGTVSQEHSRLDVKPDGQILLTNLSDLNPTTLNNHPVKSSVHVCHMDIITVADRSLRWEFPANSQYYNSPKQATPLKHGSPNIGNWAKNSANLLPESKSPLFGDHRSFKVTLGTPRFSPGKKSFQKPLSGKKVPFFLSPKPGKRTPKKRLSMKSRGYLSPEKVTDPLIIDQDSKSIPSKANSGSTSTIRKKSSPKTPSPKVHLEKPASQKVPSEKTPSPIINSKKISSPKINSEKKPMPKSNKKSSPFTGNIASLKTSSKKSLSPASRKSISSAVKKPSPQVTPKSKIGSAKAAVSNAKTSPTVQLKTSPKTPKLKNVSAKTPSPKIKASPTPRKKTAEKMPSPKSASPKILSLNKGSPKLASKITPSPKSPSKKNGTSSITPRSMVAFSKLGTPSPDVKKSPKNASQKLPSPKSKSPAKAKSPVSAKKSPLRRAFELGGRQSLLRRSGHVTQSLRVSFGPNLSPEQFDRALPPTTPLRKGGRPKYGTPSAPIYYGSPVISSDAAAGRAKRSISPAAVSPKAKKIRAEKDPVVSPKKSPTSKTASPSARSPKKSAEPSKSPKRRSSSNAHNTASPKEVPGIPLIEENVVKIFSPTSPDSKKSAALRTIHAKLVLNKTVKKSESPRTLNSSISGSSPASAKQKLLSKSRRVTDSGLSAFTELKETQSSRPTTCRSAPRVTKGATLATMSVDKSFDMRTLHTPNGPNEMFISPMTVKVDFTPSFLLKRMINASLSPDAKAARVGARLSGKIQKAVPLQMKGRFLVKSPMSDYTNVEGIKRLMRSSRKSPKSDYSNVEGIKRLMRSPRKSPKSDYTNVEGIKRLMKSPRKSPKSDYTDVEGIKRLMKSPRKSPKSDYSDVEGVKRLFRSRSKSPKSGYTDVTGIQRIFRQQKSPQADYSNVESPKRLRKSPKLVAMHEEKISTSMPVKSYPKRGNKFGPVYYLEPVSSGRKSAFKRLSPGGSPVLSAKKSPSPKASSAKKSPSPKVSSARKSPTPEVSSAKKSPSRKVSSAKKSPSPKVSSAKKSPTPEVSSAKKSPSRKVSSAKKSPSPKVSSAKKSPTPEVSSAKKSPTPKVFSAKKSPSPKVSSAKKSPSPEVSSAKKSPTPMVSSAKKSLSPTISSAKKSPSPKVFSAKKSPVLKRLSNNGSSTKKSQSRSLSFKQPGGRRSSASSSPELHKLYLSPVVSKLLSPLKNPRASRSSVSPTPVESVTRKSTTPLSTRSSKTSPALTSQKITPVLHTVSSNAKFSGKQRLKRTARSVKTLAKYSPGTLTARTLRKSLTPKKSPTKSSVEDALGQKSSTKSPFETSSTSPVKKCRAKPKKAIDTASPRNDKENDRSLEASPREKPVRRTRKALKATLKSPEKPKATLSKVSPQKSPTSPIKASPTVLAKKTRAGGKKRVVIVSPQKSRRSSIQTLLPVPAKRTRSRQKKPMATDPHSNKRKAKPLNASPKELSSPKRTLISETTSPLQIKSLPAKSPSPIVQRRKTRAKTSKVKVSPEHVKLPVRQTRKNALKSVEETPLAAPTGRKTKRKVADGEQPASKSPKLDTLPRRTKKGAVKKTSPVKMQSPKASPVAPQKKFSNKAHSPAKTVATRRSRRTRK